MYVLRTSGSVLTLVAILRVAENDNHLPTVILYVAEYSNYWDYLSYRSPAMTSICALHRQLQLYSLLHLASPDLLSWV